MALFVSLASILISVIFPIVALATIGWIIAQFRDIDTGDINTIVIYVLVPALVFHSLATTDIVAGTLIDIGLGVLLFTLAMAVIGELTGRSLKESPELLGIFVLVVLFSNAGNIGIPLAEFAFGSVGRATAVLYLVAQSIAMYTLGVFMAARGEKSKTLAGIKAIFKLPLIYAIAFAFLLRALDAVPRTDGSIMEFIALVGDSALPVMLLILGIEMASASVGSVSLRVAPPVVLRVVVSPFVAIGVALVIGFQNTTVSQVFVLLSALPTAITTLILAGEFAQSNDEGIEATEFASGTIFLTTLLSIPQIIILIYVLDAGWIF
jgi:predicted permease